MAELDAGLLADQTARVLEEAAFVFLEPDDRPPAWTDEVVVARLSWTGAGDGELTLAAAPALAAELAANLLGEEDAEAAAGRADEAVGELLNMLAGALLGELCGAGTPAVLGLPRVERLAAAACQARLEGEPVRVSLVSEERRRLDAAARVGGRP
ncbi:chemotaxis protein CheX [Anaeromyxobacter paludicola]|uniref:Chemotaxis phosphatase CheX-like domain-containing protein n=1 Tax=Anaeromyxobacter paludicola TaxID=2918171 RepID=A0ABM7X809_9BACT|nr:chemotaxis protein CheX [Anaeromyxobacter paludicola]BDG07984.1 hypothetical protein AMPC_10970 [Anaeromyxobacter paludicola]